MKERAAVSHLLRTKLRSPQMPDDYVYRPHLIERLDQGRELPLTLVSAPAGYGKSTLVSCWLKSCDRPSAWLSLDESDNDLRLFLAYFLSAAESVSPNAFPKTNALLGAAALPPLHVLVGSLVNELDQVEQDFILVLDDFHRIRERSVNDLIAELLRHPPRPLHLVMVGRTDPFLPLSSLRARSQVAEIRIRDLRFTEKETAAYLRQTLEGPIADADAAQVAKWTEGWITGLRLAALSMLHRGESSGTPPEVHGSVQYVKEYLFNEVLASQPPVIREYLLHAAILDRFCAPLCDALSRPHAGTEKEGIDCWRFIAHLKKENLFLIKLDAEEYWFRFHHLFQQLLQNQVKRHLTPEEIAALHSRASNWFEGKGLVDEAIHHALAAGDAADAVDIVERHYHEELNQHRWYVLDQWLKKLPPEITRQRPGVLLAGAAVAFYRWQFPKLATILDQVEPLLTDETDTSDLRVELNFYRAALHFWESNTEQSERGFEMVMKRMGEEKQKLLGKAELHFNLSRYMNGNGASAIKALNDQLLQSDSSDTVVAVMQVATLSFIFLLSGDLFPLRLETRRLRELAKQSSAAYSIPYVNSWSYYMEGAAYLHRLELDAASQHLSAACEHPYIYDARPAVDALAGLALAHQLMGRPGAAHETLQRLIQFAYEGNDPVLVHVAHACEARIGLLQGNCTPAIRWAKTESEPLDLYALFFWLEVPQITRARVLIADGSTASLGTASELLQEMRELSEARRLTCQTIEIAVLQSLALEKQGRSDEALDVLGQIVALAAPGGWIRPFVEAGPIMAELLKKLLKRKGPEDHINAILDAFRAYEQSVTPDTFDDDLLHSDQRIITSPHRPIPQSLIEPLSLREIEVLELLVKRNYNKEIADKLNISTETVKTHVRHLYQKLSVNNRRAAIAKAGDLGILADGSVKSDTSAQPR